LLGGVGDIKHPGGAQRPAPQGRGGDGIWQNAGKLHARLALVMSDIAPCA